MASCRDHTFLHKLSFLTGEIASFTVSAAESTAFDTVPITSDSSKDGQGSMLVIHPQF